MAIAVHDWNEAFDVCRERDKPQVVRDPTGQRTKIYPSGSDRILYGRSGGWDIEIVPTVR